MRFLLSLIHQFSNIQQSTFQQSKSVYLMTAFVGLFGLLSLLSLGLNRPLNLSSAFSFCLLLPLGLMQYMSYQNYAQSQAPRRIKRRQRKLA